MAVRARYDITLGISSTTAEERDLGNATYGIVTDSYNIGGTWKTDVGTLVTDVSISLANITTGSLLIIRTNTVDPTLTPVSLNFKLNSTGNTPITVAPLTGATEGHLLLSTSGLTALYCTNASSTVAMEVTVTIVGV